MKFALEAVGEARFRDAFMTAFRSRPPRVAPPAAEGPLPDAEVGRILGFVPPGGWSSGVRPQRRPGLATATVNVPLGDLIGGDFRTLAELARLGDGRIYLTRNQNVMFRDLPHAVLPKLRRGLADRRLALAGANEAIDVRACTGSAVCALGITAAPDTGSRLMGSPAVLRNASLRIHVSGCPNSCAQHQAADVGLSGAKVRIKGQTRSGYYVWIGADLASGSLATQVGRVAEEDVNDVVEAVLGVWEALRQPRETLAATLARVGADAFRAQVAACTDGFQPGEDTVVDRQTLPEPVSVS
jgi:sulfite reductase beta subunit-like hemoprotein